MGTKIVYDGTYTDGAKWTLEAAEWASILNVQSGMISVYAGRHQEVGGWTLERREVQTGEKTKKKIPSWRMRPYWETIEGMVHEATRRGISYGDLQQELLCKKYTKIKPPPGLIEERRRKQRKKILAEMEAKKKATRGRTT